MAVLSCLPDSGAGGERNEKFEPGYRVDFKVLASGTDCPKAILDGLSSSYNLTIGKPYNLGSFGVSDSDAGAILKSISVDRVTQGPISTWKATVSWGIFDPLVDVQNPLNDPVMPVLESVVTPKYAVSDKDGNACLNTAGEPFEPFEIEQTHWVTRFSKNYAALPAYWAYLDYINNATWQGFAAYYVKFNSMRCTQESSTYLASTYYKVDFEFEYKPDTWLFQVLNAGYYQKVSGALRPCTFQGQPVSKPWPLDSSGVQIAVPTTGNAIFKNFHIRNEVDFVSTFTDFPADLFAVQAYPT